MSNQIQMSNDKHYYRPFVFDIKAFDIDLAFGFWHLKFFK